MQYVNNTAALHCGGVWLQTSQNGVTTDFVMPFVNMSAPSVSLSDIRFAKQLSVSEIAQKATECFVLVDTRFFGVWNALNTRRIIELCGDGWVFEHGTSCDPLGGLTVFVWNCGLPVNTAVSTILVEIVRRSELVTAEASWLEQAHRLVTGLTRTSFYIGIRSRH